MDAFACNVSSITGLGFAIAAIAWRSKYPACKASYLPSVLTIVAFALGTLCGLIISTCWLQLTGSEVLSALRSAGLSALFYSPLYILAMISKVETIARNMLWTVVVVTVVSAGILLGSYVWYYNSIQAAPFNTSVIVVCTTIMALGLLVGLQKADIGTLFGFLVDVAQFTLLALAVRGVLAQSDILCIPLLIFTVLVMVPCSWFTCRMAWGCRRTLRALMDPQTGLSAVQRPKPRGPRELTSNEELVDMATLEVTREPSGITPSPTAGPPVTFPTMACKAPPEAFLTSTRHVFVIPNYKESLELLETTLRALASHPNAPQRYAILLAMEKAESGGADKAYLLEEKFRHSFIWIGHTFHELRQGELAGKGSNLNAAVQQLMQLEWASAKTDAIMLTVMDSDTELSAEYIQGVDWVWASHPKAAATGLLCPTTPLIANSREAPFMVRAWELFYYSCIDGQMGHEGALRLPLACYSMLLATADEIGYWEPGLSGIAEDQHTALRTYIHFKRKASQAQIIGILAPYWGQCELDYRCKARQQIRHFFGFQDIWFAMTKTQGLPIADRVHIVSTVASPLLLAVACPIVGLGTSIIINFSQAPPYRLAALTASFLGLPQLPAACILLYYVQYMWAFSEGTSAHERRGVCQLLRLVLVFPVVFVTQYVCGLYAKLWLLASELGMAPIVYEGARQGTARPLVPV